MRVAFVARRYWPALGGVETLLRDVAQALARSNEITVLAQRVDDGPTSRLHDAGLREPPPFTAFDDRGVRVAPLRLPMRRRALVTPLAYHTIPVLRRYAYGRSRLWSGLLYARAVAPSIGAQVAGADVVHVWGGDLLAFAAVEAAHAHGALAIITPFAHRGHWGDDPASAEAYRRADAVIALSETDAAVYRDLGVQPQRITDIGVSSPGVAVGGGSALRASMSIKGPLIVFLGVRRSYKGFDRLLAAAPLVAVHRPDVTFALLGPGEPLPRDVGNARVLDVGLVDETSRAAWLEAADILCLPSESEIFPVTFLEAWSARTAVVGSRTPTIVELIGRSGGGWSVDTEPSVLADALLAALSDEAQLHRRAEAGYRFWSENYTVDAVAARHARLYERVIARRGAQCVA